MSRPLCLQPRPGPTLRPLLVALLGLIPCLAASCGTSTPAEAAALSQEELEERISELALDLVEPDAMATNTDFLEWKNS